MYNVRCSSFIYRKKGGLLICIQENKKTEEILQWKAGKDFTKVWIHCIMLGEKFTESNLNGKHIQSNLK